MERRDYLEREIEKMRAVLQKIFGMRVDKDEEVQELISTELKYYFDVSKDDIIQMNETDFRLFIQTKNVSLIGFLGSLLCASVDLDASLTAIDKMTLQKTLIAWEVWELKTKTLDLERLETKEKIISLLASQQS